MVSRSVCVWCEYRLRTFPRAFVLSVCDGQYPGCLVAHQEFSPTQFWELTTLRRDFVAVTTDAQLFLKKTLCISLCTLQAKLKEKTYNDVT